jgi:4-hydroxybutyrate CoA-transferase
MKFISPDEAVSIVQSNYHIFLHGVGATPHILISALVRRADELQGVKIYHLHTEGNAEYAQIQYQKSFTPHVFFISANTREAVQDGRAEYIPMFLSEIPNAFRKKIIPLDVAMIQVSPPDKHGYCSLGVSVDIALAAVQSATYVIAVVNKYMPRTHGAGQIHYSHCSALVEDNTPLISPHKSELSETDHAIAHNVSTLVEDGATLQMGIGSIPDAVLLALTNHRDLGIHTEMFSDGVIPLVEKGVITNNLKKVRAGKIVSGFVVGSQKLYDFVDDNPSVYMGDIGMVNDTAVIRKNPKVTAINSAIEVDVTGQVCADSIGCKMYSGVGGQMDFIRGASLSEGGKPIIALPSVTSKGESRISAILKPGAGVVTTRAHVRFVVTEHGIADLYGKSLTERIRSMIAIAHPNHRSQLEEAVYATRGKSL